MWSNKPSLYESSHIQMSQNTSNDMIVTFCAECGNRTGTVANNVYAIVQVFRTENSKRSCVSDTQAICLSCIKKVGEREEER